MAVEGADLLKRRFKAIPGAVRKAVREELERNADLLVAEMRRFAPVGETGRLRISINWTWGDAPEGSLVIGEVGGNQFGVMRITIYAGGGTAFYARFQEFGTVNMAANPFFFPIWRIRRRRTRGGITRAMNKAIKEAYAK